MDLQKLMDVLNEQNRLTRGQYQMTLGGLIAALQEMPGDAEVAFNDDGRSPDPESLHSYRGYYSDLAIDSHAGKTLCRDLLASLVNADGESFEGYKGGDYVMDDDTPVWRDSYSEAKGIAIMDAYLADDGRVILTTKKVD